MKTKITTLILLLVSIYTSADPFYFIIDIHKKQKYHTIYIDDTRTQCIGIGHLDCGILMSNLIAGSEKGIYHVGEIIDYVYKQMENGNTTGNELFQNAMPVKWRPKGTEEIEIMIDAKEITGYPDKN